MPADAASTFPAIRADSGPPDNRPVGTRSDIRPAGAQRPGRPDVRGNPSDPQAMYSPVNAACSSATISLSRGIRGLVRMVGSA